MKLPPEHVWLLKKWFTPWKLTILVLLSFFILFSFWYRGNSPLTDTEASQFLSFVETLDEPHQQFILQNDMENFLSNDDGKPFYVVNLFRYVPETGSETLTQFSRAVIPLWLRYGSHPIFSSTEFTSNKDTWDRITIVRYRSRRDWVDIVSSEAFAKALPLRLSASVTNQRFTVTGIAVPNLILLLGIMMGFIAGSVYVYQQIQFGKRTVLKKREA